MNADQDDAPFVTPTVARAAAERGVDLAEVTGTGVAGRIRVSDVLAAAPASAGASVPNAAHTTWDAL